MKQEPRLVVVVEDDAGLRDAIERVLTAAGFQARAFPSAEQLLEASAARSAACLVLDIHLPALSGFDLYRRLESLGMRRPAVFITARDEPENRQQASSAGAEYLSKPFAGRTLVDAVTRAIGP